MTRYLALVHPKSGTIHLILVSEQGEPVGQRSMVRSAPEGLSTLK